ncbi:MAG: hypothetical protein KDE31_31965, partial [Caldilineaceae bacterium]|nr:hypothetical protein [Caldilineaceae bacterium]MCB0188944.1 hypothetical protein [Caldilineaceae bacterium]
MQRTTHLGIFWLVSSLLWLLFTSLLQTGALGQTIPDPNATPTATPTELSTATPTATPTTLPTATAFPTPIAPQPTSTAAPTGGDQQPCTYNPWRFTTNMTTKRFDHALVSANNFLYALGSYEYGGVERAAINADGTLGLWQRETLMIYSRHAPAAVAHGDYLYVLGGAGNAESTEYAALHADGSVGSWQQSASMVKPRWYFAAVTANGYLYAIGGDNETPATVERAPINANGSLGAWELISTMNFERHSRNAIVIDGFIYVVGDSQNAGQTDSIERAALNPDGTLGNWQVVGSLPVGRADGTVLTANGAL